MLQQCLPFTVLKRFAAIAALSMGFTVATVLTVYGIETIRTATMPSSSDVTLQQCLPFTVLKLLCGRRSSFGRLVATVLTVYGIETCNSFSHDRLLFYVATVLTVYGIETK